MRARLPFIALFLTPLVMACASAPPGPARFAMEPCPAPPADNAQVVQGFYDAFARRDFQGMACAYDKDVEFTDSMFGTLHGKRAFAMWAMLTSGAKDLVVKASNIGADGDSAHAHWDADYTFSFLVFDNPVHNQIDATFTFKGGKIVKHRDSFDLPKWMKMALTPMDGVVSEASMKERVQARLDEFIANHPEFQDNPAPTP
ncbi:MAG: nuclear transport factor 2 family protein [Polyangiaceae bacterium]